MAPEKQLSRSMRIAQAVMARLSVAAEAPAVITDKDWDDFRAGRGDWEDAVRKREWRGYVLKMSSETTTPESASIGDVDKRGWVFQGHRYDSLDSALDDRNVAHHNWMEWSSSGTPRPGDWLVSEAEPDYRTGAETTFHLWIDRGDHKPMTKAEISFINKSFGIR